MRRRFTGKCYVLTLYYTFLGRVVVLSQPTLIINEEKYYFMDSSHVTRTIKIVMAV